MKKILWFSLLIGLSNSAAALCFQAAGLRYQLDPFLLEAMAIQESGLNPRAININRNKAGQVLSTDFGLMQINSLHIPKLKALGVITSKEDLLNNACLNVQIGAWILAKHLKICGGHWQCLGSYNAGFSKNTKTQDDICQTGLSALSKSAGSAPAPIKHTQKQTFSLIF